MFRPSEHSPRDPRRSRDRSARGNAQRRNSVAAGRPRAHAPDVEESPSVQGAWLLPPMALLAVACALRLAVRGADSNFATCFAVLLAVGVSWVGLRLWMPAPQPPACPNCKRKALVRLDRQQAVGARCQHCGWRDEAADARRLAAPVALEPKDHGARRATRVTLLPRDNRRGLEGDSRGRPFGERPPPGPSGRGRRRR
ncbi:MAG TPA: hypothetical protein VM509_09360 [Planctomycetota bacterium]|nr:hypothetical protein [Planctomycetota bacterium]